MTFARFLRIFRELNNIKIYDIARELNMPESKIRAYERNRDNYIIEKWYIDHGLDLEEYQKVRERYYGKENKETEIKPEGSSD